MQVEPVDVGQVDVQQHQVGLQLPGFTRASAPVWAAPTTENPGVCWIKPAWILATMKSSSTIRTLIMARRLPLRPSTVPVKTAPAVVVHRELAAAALADHPGQRQAKAPAPFGGGSLGGEALPEDSSSVPRRQPRARVSRTTTHTCHPPSSITDIERRASGVLVTASRALSTRLPTTVVRSLDKSLVHPAQAGLRVKLQCHAPLGGQAGLGNEQCRQRRVLDPAGDLVVEPGPAPALHRSRTAPRRRTPRSGSGRRSTCSWLANSWAWARKRVRCGPGGAQFASPGTTARSGRAAW